MLLDSGCCYASHAGSPEAERVAFWQRLSESVREVAVDIVPMGDHGLRLPGLVDGRHARVVDRACIGILIGRTADRYSLPALAAGCIAEGNAGHARGVELRHVRRG